MAGGTRGAGVPSVRGARCIGQSLTHRRQPPGFRDRSPAAGELVILAWVTCCTPYAPRARIALFPDARAGAQQPGHLPTFKSTIALFKYPTTADVDDVEEVNLTFKPYNVMVQSEEI
jgi:hypothetical protein